MIRDCTAEINSEIEKYKTIVGLYCVTKMFDESDSEIP